MGLGEGVAGIRHSKGSQAIFKRSWKSMGFGEAVPRIRERIGGRLQVEETF